MTNGPEKLVGFGWTGVFSASDSCGLITGPLMGAGLGGRVGEADRGWLVVSYATGRARLISGKYPIGEEDVPGWWGLNGPAAKAWATIVNELLEKRRTT